MVSVVRIVLNTSEGMYDDVRCARCRMYSTYYLYVIRVDMRITGSRIVPSTYVYKM